MNVNKNFLLVLIDKKKQLAKKSKIGNIYVPPAYEFMLYNLQHGKILQMGRKAKALFPEAEAGDIALFHHTVESKSLKLARKSPNGDEQRLAEITDANMNNQVYGVIKDDGRLIPMKQYLFLSVGIEKLRRRPVSNSILLGAAAKIDEDMWEDEDRLKLKMEDNLKRLQDLDKTMWYEPNERKRDDINRDMQRIELENEELTQFIAKPKLAIANTAFIHPDVSHETGVSTGTRVVVEKDLLIPFDIDGNLFYITLMDFVHGKLN